MLTDLSARHPVIQRVVGTKPPDRPLIGVSPGSGNITATSVRAGADIFFVFSAGTYRTAGVGSLASFLAYGNANDQTEELLRRHVLPHNQGVPVVAGMMPNDPAAPTAERLQRLGTLGVDAVTNWPATGLVDGVMRDIMISHGLHHEAELDMLQEAQAAGFAVFGFALSPSEVEHFCDIHVDGLILNVGLTRAVTDTMEKKNELSTAIATVREMWDVVARQTLSPLSFLFGGSITQPIDLEEILREVPVHGYAGGSAFERIPVTAIVDSTIRRLKSVPRTPSATRVRAPLVGDSRQMRRVLELIERTAPHDVNICILGETGTGKELVAHAVHQRSPRREMPFVTMNCGAIPDSLVESEFFGHEKGAFTGAHDRRKGKFELANHGILFLDEIGDLSPHGQVALLRVIQQGEVFRLGSQKATRVDVQIIAATNRDLRRDVAEGRFRSDLFYRISTIVIETPPLRERPGDIAPIADHLLRLLASRLNRRIVGITDEFRERLIAYSWPGNVRELEHVLTRSAILEDSAVLDGTGVLLENYTEAREVGSRATRSGAAAPRETPDARRRRASETILRCSGNKSEAARQLGISRKTLYQWLRE